MYRYTVYLNGVELLSTDDGSIVAVAIRDNPTAWFFDRFGPR